MERVWVLSRWWWRRACHKGDEEKATQAKGEAHGRKQKGGNEGQREYDLKYHAGWAWTMASVTYLPYEDKGHEHGTTSEENRADGGGSCAGDM